jgi:TRAP-type uncharacterized transport system fused permease subunit
MFVLSPTLLMIGTPATIVYDSITAFIGIYYATIGIVGFFQRAIGPLSRLFMIVAGAAAILPDSAIGIFIPGFVSATGVLAGGAYLAFEYFNHRRSALVRSAAE